MLSTWALKTWKTNDLQFAYEDFLRIDLDFGSTNDQKKWVWVVVLGRNLKICNIMQS